MRNFSSFSTFLLTVGLLPVSQAWGQTAAENYSATNVVQQAGYTQESALTGLPADQLRQDVTYYDGLGRAVQQVAIKQSPAQQDIVTHRTYDAQGRPAVSYLPFVVSGNGAFQAPQVGYNQPNVPTQQAPFYQNKGDRIANDAAPWAVTNYEASPLKRVVRQGAVGLAWQPNGNDVWNNADHTLRYLRRSNQAGEVRQWNCGNAPRTLSSPGYYGAGQLNVQETKDENGHISLTYEDQEGQVVCKKVQEAPTLSIPYVDAEFMVTQYVYDAFNRLRVVIQPEGLRHQSSPSYPAPGAFFDTYCFRYEYDERGRVIEKQVPGAGPTELVYNQRNQLILQRGHTPLHSRGWLFTKYDGQGRPILTGQVTLTNAGGSPLTRAEAQLQASQSPLASWERMTPSTDLGYTLTESYPAVTSDAAVLTVTYYDSYEYAAFANAAFTAENGLGLAACSKLAAGQVTGQRARVLDGTTVLNQWLLTTLFYDDEHRLIQSRRDLYPSGAERTTLELDFLGRPTRTLVRHSFPSSSAVDRTILQEFTYDHAGRLRETRQQIDGQPKLVLARQEYNELGQLVDKKLHSPDYLAGSASQHFLQSVDYRYNIRGWMSHINDRNLSNGTQFYGDVDPNTDTNNEDPDLFGMELMYDTKQNLQQSPVQYNGNISEVMWHTLNSRTGDKLRGYAYSYDAANRITAAPYRTHESAGWGLYSGPTSGDYSVSNVTYDANGNLLSMDRKGQTSAPGASSPTWGNIDRLRYSYRGNRMIGVDDDASTSSTHDFKDNTGVYTRSDEYDYDALGNLTVDRNKRIQSISYNLLNRPAQIDLPVFSYNRSISYVYSAAGEKLQKRTNDGSISRTTSYAGGFVYEDNVLKFAPTPEGRMLYTAPSSTGSGSLLNWKYEYFLKDHLGNLRFAFRAEKDGTQETQLVGMEPANATAEESKFTHVAETRLADPNHARSGRYVARLNAREGRRSGPTISLKVAAGDSVRAEVFGRYDRQRASGRALAAGALSGSLVVAAPVVPAPEGAPGPPTTRSRHPLLGASLTLIPQLLHLGRAALPVAYLRYEVYNRDSQLVATTKLPLRRTATDEWQPLRARLKADSAGYVRISVENESPDAAYFDDMSVSRTASTPVQENHYDPFGLNLVGIEDAGSYDSQFQFNSKEKQPDMGLNWTDYGARMYDAQLGRWHSNDPMADLTRRNSPYSYALNNPIRFIDPDGMTAREHYDGKDAQDWWSAHQQASGTSSNSTSDGEYEVDNKTNEVRKISNMGDEDGVDFYHHVNGGSNNGRTEIVNRGSGESVWTNSSKFIRGYMHRGAEVGWFGIFLQWYTGYGPEKSLMYGANHHMITDLMNTPMYQLALGKFQAGGGVQGRVPFNFGLVDLVSTPNMTGQMMGSTNFNFYPVGDKLVIMATDSKSISSWTLIPWWDGNEVNIRRINGAGPPESNTYQTYIWTIPNTSHK